MSARPSPHRQEVEALDRFVDLCLDEHLAGRRPPDLVDRVLDAGEPERLRAASALDRATLDAHAAPRWWLGIAFLCAAVALAVAGIRFTGGARDDASDSDRHDVATVERAMPSSEVATPEPRDPLQPFLDRFHAAVPREPWRLRDAALRASVATECLPALRGLLAVLRADPARSDRARLVPEFEVYALLMGASDVERSVRERGDAEAELVASVATFLAAEPETERSLALERLVARIDASEPIPPFVERTLVVADLRESELAPLLDRDWRPHTHEFLEREAARARRNPRRWIGSPITLDGSLRGGGSLSTEAWRGRPGIAVFWASWCEPSHAMLDAVVAARARHAARSISAVGIPCDDDVAGLDAHLRRHPEHAWPQLVDPVHPGWHDLAFAHGVLRLPAAFLIDAEGVLRDVVHSPSDLAGAVDRLLRESRR